MFSVTTANHPSPLVNAVARSPSGSRMMSGNSTRPISAKRMTNNETIVRKPAIMVMVRAVTNHFRYFRFATSLAGTSFSSMSRIVRVEIQAGPPSRLDKALARDVPEEAHLSRSRLVRLLAEGAVSRNGDIVSDVRAAVTEGDVFEIVIEDPAEVETAPEDLPVTVVWEDADLAVVNKPAGMVVHPAPGSRQGTLVNALLHRFGDDLSGVGGRKRPGIVHRIDKDTSGLLVVAKSDAAHHGLARQFANHSIDRKYTAVCHGIPDSGDPRLAGIAGVSFEAGAVIRIHTMLARHKTDRQRQAVLFDGGRTAITRLTVIETFGRHAALLECLLETGRTHQIRVHAAYIGHALVGDPVYGGRRRPPGDAPGASSMNSFPRQALHATTLGFTHPVTGQSMRFTSEIPEDMAALVRSLRGGDR